MNVDPKFTKNIQDWLNTDPKTDDMAVSGSELLRRIAPKNRIYMRFFSLSLQHPANIIRKVEYELKKHLKYRLDGLTLDEVNRLDRITIPEATKILTEGMPDDGTADDDNSEGKSNTVATTVRRLGKRTDHDKLPADIQALWTDNGELYKSIKATFEELKSMDDMPSCDRYDKLQLLASMDKKYFRQMQTYDEFVVSDDNVSDATTTDKAADDASSAVGSARSYLSKNSAKLAELKSAADVDGADDNTKVAYADLLAKMQERVNIIIAADAAIKDETRAALVGLGVVFENEEHSGNSETAE